MAWRLLSDKDWTRTIGSGQSWKMFMALVTFLFRAKEMKKKGEDETSSITKVYIEKRRELEACIIIIIIYFYFYYFSFF